MEVLIINSEKIGILTVIIAIISLILAFLVFANLNPEGWIKKEGAPVLLTDIPAGDSGAYTGKTAGDDVKKLTGSKELEDIIGTQYISAVPKEVIKTGVYGLKPWLDPYKITSARNGRGRMYRTGRKAAEATNKSLFAVSSYIEYYLIKLPDDTYILAQFSDTCRKAIEKGETITLPLGIRKATGKETRTLLKDICSRYGANPDFVLYSIDNEWNEEHEFTLFMIRFGISAVVFLILSVTMLTAADKIRNRN